MKLIGLTGGIGCGKSFLSRHLDSIGARVIDTDSISRQLLVPGQPALELVRQTFGDGICGHDGSLDRQKLSQIVFNDQDSLRRLEQILHPRIREVWEGVVHQWKQQGSSLGVVVIPLLFETGVQDRFDVVISMACSAETQNDRLQSRGWDDAHIQKRISAQWPLLKKMEASHYIIWTDTRFPTTILQWELIKNHMLKV